MTSKAHAEKGKVVARDVARGSGGPRPHPALGLHNAIGNRGINRLMGARTRRDPDYRRGYLGIATCSEQGVVNTYVPGEHCAGDCVQQHENVHVADMSLCCARYSSCLNSAPDVGGRQQCRESWLDYMNHLEDYTECNAYQTEFDCLTSLLIRECTLPGASGAVSPDCCKKLDQEHANVTTMITRHCPKAVPWPCPFP